MIIKKVVLENIRSYKKQIIEFPKGSVLLSGDIGTGKSSILLAIEFALFGLKRNNLSGASLLRNGEKKGSVNLYFSIDEKEIEIYRTLKRNSLSVSQDSGYIIIDGIKKEGTAIELKQAVIDLLNYPKDLLTKSKSPIYRYTVYTPQETMKHILLCSEDERLETLRKVFGIDKYKRITENAKIIISKLREKIKEQEGYISDLNIKKNNLQIKESELNEFMVKFFEIEVPFKEKNLVVEKNKTELQRIESEKENFENIKKQIDILEINLKNEINLKENLENQILKLNQEINNSCLKEIKNEKSDIEEKINEKIKMMDALSLNLQNTKNKIQEIKTKTNASNETIDKINTLDNCPTCYQKVTLEYKNRVLESEKSKIVNLEENLRELKEKEKRLEIKNKNIQENLEELKKQIHEIELEKIKSSALTEKKVRLNKLKEENEEIKEKIDTLKTKKQVFLKQMNGYEKIHQVYIEVKKRLEKNQEMQKQMEIQISQLKTKIETTKDYLNNLKEDVQKKEKIKKKMEYANSTKYWLKEQFINIVQEMEKKIMHKVHSDFNDLFEKWFDVLIDTPNLIMSLDESFSPLIEQNGYEIEYAHLSGGEKTAAALAYRLALNQVINNLITTIKTKDLIILDEPSDGFSNEQLDKLRIIFNELDVKQLIIVSHEPKVESFVENVIKFTKTEHLSSLYEV